MSSDASALEIAAALIATYSGYTGYTPEQLIEGLVDLHLHSAPPRATEVLEGGAATTLALARDAPHDRLLAQRRLVVRER